MPDSSFHQWPDVDQCSPSPDFALSFSDCVLDGVQMSTRVSLNLIAEGWEIKFTKSTQECVTFKGNGGPLTQPLQNMCVIWVWLICCHFHSCDVQMLLLLVISACRTSLSALWVSCRVVSWCHDLISWWRGSGFWGDVSLQLPLLGCWAPPYFPAV